MTAGINVSRESTCQGFLEGGQDTCCEVNITNIRINIRQIELLNTYSDTLLGYILYLIAFLPRIR